MKNLLVGFTILSCLLVGIVQADFEIDVDYTYDTNNFFNSTERRAGLEAAAARYSNVINSSLSAVPATGTGIGGTSAGWRIGFTHPGNGSSYELSTAASCGTDTLAGNNCDPSNTSMANGYGFAGLAADKWTLFAGGRPLSSAGIGGTATGVNFSSTFADPNGPHNRGVFTTTSPGSLPAWGGSISFDTGQQWHFNPKTATSPGSQQLDLYTIALHEIGHALGLSISFDEWESNVSGSQYSGSNAVTAYNADNGTSLTSLGLVSSGNQHWADGTYDSKIFPHGNPNTVGTVTLNNPQDLLMEPVANFTAAASRFELTNVDVGALQDVGWSVVSGGGGGPTATPQTVAIAGDAWNVAPFSLSDNAVSTTTGALGSADYVPTDLGWINLNEIEVAYDTVPSTDPGITLLGTNGAVISTTSTTPSPITSSTLSYGFPPLEDGLYRVQVPGLDDIRFDVLRGSGSTSPTSKGVVNFLDFSAVAGNFGDTSTTALLYDFAGDGVVNFLDFSAVAGNFLNDLPTAEAPAPTSVPEPSSALPLVIALTHLSLFRRRRK